MARPKQHRPPAQRITLEQIIEDRGGPWYEGLAGYEGLDPVVGLYLVGPGLDLGPDEEQVLEAAWESYRLAVRREQRARGCPHGREYNADTGEWTRWHQPGDRECLSWWEEQTLRQAATRRRRGRPA